MFFVCWCFFFFSSRASMASFCARCLLFASSVLLYLQLSVSIYIYVFFFFLRCFLYSSLRVVLLLFLFYFLFFDQSQFLWYSSKIVLPEINSAGVIISWGNWNVYWMKKGRLRKFLIRCCNFWCENKISFSILWWERDIADGREGKYFLLQKFKRCWGYVRTGRGTTMAIWNTHICKMHIFFNL